MLQKLNSQFLLGAAAVLLALAGCGGAPQAGIDDDDVYKELDALYTAVTTRRQDLLDACRSRFKKLHDERRVPDAAFKEVTSIADEAAKGNWSDAALRLSDFMRAQRRTKSSH